MRKDPGLTLGLQLLCNQRKICLQCFQCCGPLGQVTPPPPILGDSARGAVHWGGGMGSSCKGHFGASHLHGMQTESTWHPVFLETGGGRVLWDLSLSLNPTPPESPPKVDFCPKVNNPTDIGQLSYKIVATRHLYPHKQVATRPLCHHDSTDVVVHCCAWPTIFSCILSLSILIQCFGAHAQCNLQHWSIIILHLPTS